MRYFIYLMAIATLTCAAAAQDPWATQKPDSAEGSHNIIPVTLPHRISGSNLVIRNAEQWQAYNGQASAALCDWTTSMLVAQRASFGSSGCSSPASGITRVEVMDEEVRVSAHFGRATGYCQAYFKPIAAACVPTSNLPVRFD